MVMDDSKHAVGLKFANGAEMLILVGRFGLEGQQVLARMIFGIGDGSGHRPEIGVEIPEIHIDGDLDGLGLEILGLIGLVHDDHPPVGDSAHQGGSVGAGPYRHHVEKGLPHGDGYHQDGHGDAHPQAGSQREKGCDYNGAEQVDQGYGTV